MADDVNGLSGISTLTGSISVRYGEPDCRETGNSHGMIRARRTVTDHVSPNSQEAMSLTDAESSEKRQVPDCAIPVLSQLVSRILQDQYTANRISDGGLESIVMDMITPENARALAAEDGHWQPDQTASRIISFALTISGNNQNKINKIKECIISGFQLAGESFGGELPDISGRTFIAIMNGLRRWADNPDYSGHKSSLDSP